MPTITECSSSTGPSFSNESFQTLFFNKAAGCARKMWSGDKTSTKVV